MASNASSAKLPEVPADLERIPLVANTRSLGWISDRVLSVTEGAPPFWWWAWLQGLDAYGTPLEPVYATVLLWVLVGGYVAQRLIEGIFIKRLGLEIHVWRPIDSKFRLITARRNPNMVILAVALLSRRPGLGLELVAAWTLASLIFHAVRLAQANELLGRGQRITSWLEA